MVAAAGVDACNMREMHVVCLCVRKLVAHTEFLGELTRHTLIYGNHGSIHTKNQ